MLPFPLKRYEFISSPSLQAAPIGNFPIPAMTIASHELIEAHLNDFMQDKILMQVYRHDDQDNTHVTIVMNACIKTLFTLS